MVLSELADARALFDTYRAIGEAVGVVCITALYAFFRNWAVEGPAFNRRFLFVGSDLMIGFIGIGLVLFFRMVCQYLLNTPSNEVELFAMGVSSIFVAAVPLFYTCIQTEQIIYGPPRPRWRGLLGINVVAGALPLGGAMYLVANLFEGCPTC
jgi:hypothetical protein